jgi:hypothetical protein
MGNTQQRRVITLFGLGKKLDGCVPLLGDFASYIVARPNEGSVKSSKSAFARNKISLVSGAA